MDIFDGLSALGGLCLFLFGMSIMAEALQRRAGGRLGGQLRRMTRSRWAGFFTGLAVTAAVQSSSAAMVMVVGFVNSGLLTLGQAVGVIMGTNVGTTVTPWLLSLGGLEGGGFPGRLLRPAGFVPLLSLWGIIAYLSRNGRRRDTGQALLGFATLMQGMELMSGSVAGLAQAEGFRRLFTAFTDPLLGLLAGAVLTAVIHTAFNLLCTMLLFPAAGLLERAVLRLLPGEDGEKGTELDPRLLAAPAAALEKCRELAGDMAALARDNLRRGVAALTEVQPASAKELRRQEERIDRMEDVLGTFLVRLSGQTLTRRDNARAAELLALIGDFERLGDHAMNLLESGEELRDKDISLPAEDRRELRALTDAVEEIADLALDAFRREDPAAQAEVEALEQVIDGLKEQLRSRRIRRMQQGSGTMELGFVWSDVLTDLERAADHCSNIAGCVAGLPDGNQGLHAAQTALRQQDPAFEDRVRRYAEKYRV